MSRKEPQSVNQNIVKPPPPPPPPENSPGGRRKMGKVYLGDEVRDSLSGFQGIATGRAEYLTGCVQILVAAKSQKAGEKPFEYWLDEQRLVVTSAGAYGLPEEEINEAPAGPQHVPPARHP